VGAAFTALAAPTDTPEKTEEAATFVAIKLERDSAAEQQKKQERELSIKANGDAVLRKYQDMLMDLKK
jgi:hypothetical protein